jgi:hypothetical protein
MLELEASRSERVSLWWYNLAHYVARIMRTQVPFVIVSWVVQHLHHQRVSEDAIHLCQFPLSLLGKAKQWFYANQKEIDTWYKFSMVLLNKFFPMGKTNALHRRISSFQASSIQISSWDMGKASGVHLGLSSPWDGRMSYSLEFLQQVDPDNLWSHRCRC